VAAMSRRKRSPAWRWNKTALGAWYKTSHATNGSCCSSALGLSAIHAQQKPAPATLHLRLRGRRRAVMSSVDPALLRGMRYPVAWTVTRRPGHGRHRRTVAARHVLHGRGERRTVQDR
jgi:hypothetical protein